MLHQPNTDPLDLLNHWFAEARRADTPLPEAAALATADRHGRPSVRTVLIKGRTEQGFDFYTNLGSQKARELNENPQASLLLHWKLLGRQVRISGPVRELPAEHADSYFASRPRMSRIGAWASEQSQPLLKGDTLEGRVARATARFGLGPVPRPSFWGGFRLFPEHMEFWWRGRFRLHTRWLFERTDEGWKQTSLQP